MAPPFRETVHRRLAERRPRSILGVGALGETLVRDYLSAHPETRFVALAPREALAQLPRLPRFAHAFLTEAFETLSRDEAAALLAGLRDVHAEHLFLALETSSGPGGWAPAELVALGLQPVESHGDLALYEFDIARYKTTPDWLNSDHWAHPELFDKFRW